MAVKSKPKSTASIMKFPCEYPVKVMGYSSDEFSQAVKKVIKAFDEEVKDSDFEEKLSRDGKYLSINAKVYAKSKESLDGLYWDLNAHELVLVTL